LWGSSQRRSPAPLGESRLELGNRERLAADRDRLDGVDLFVGERCEIGQQRFAAAELGAGRPRPRRGPIFGRPGPGPWDRFLLDDERPRMK
jgi:hypothetical protein